MDAEPPSSAGAQPRGLPVPLEGAPAFPSPADGEGGPAPEVLQAARGEELWETDIVRLPWTIQDDPEALPSLVSVMAGPYLLGTDVLRKPSGEPPEVAMLLQRTLEESAELVGAWPERVRVRQEEVVHHLARLLKDHGVAVESSSYLVHLDPMSRQLVQSHGAPEGKLVYSFPGTWASWGLPEGLTGELFEAAAALYQAAPWDALRAERGLEARLPDGRTWYVALLQPRRMPPGISVYEHPDDLAAAGIASSPEEVARSIAGRFYTLLYGPASELPEAMRREIETRGWTVAGPDASPCLMAVNTPGGVIREADGRDLVTIARALTGLGEHAHADLEGRAVGEAWRDPATGVRLGFMEPDALARGLEMAVERQNRSPRQELGGLSALQVHRLLTSEWTGEPGPFTLARDLGADEATGARVVRNARTFLSAAEDEGGAPATRHGNLSRAFVQRMLDELEWPSTPSAAARRETVREGNLPALRLIRGLLEEAGLLERSRGRFRVTDRGHGLLERARAPELHRHLFETLFRRMDLGWLGGTDRGTEFQHAVPYALHRYRSAGRDWSTAGEVAAVVVLPPVREAMDARGAGSEEVVEVVRRRFLAPLEEFGLVESEGGPDAPSELRYRKTLLYDRFLEFAP